MLGDLPSQREVWEDAALYVDPSDDRALAETLAGLVADEARRADLARRARARALTYAPARMAAGYQDAYARAASAAPATVPATVRTEQEAPQPCAS